MIAINFKGKTITNWIDYVNYKFADTNFFEIKASEGHVNITIESKTNNTKIYFSGLFDRRSLGDCQYFNDNCKGWSGETVYKDPENLGILTLENVKEVDRILDTPIYNGWASIEYYLFGIFFKSKSYPDNNKKKKPFTDLSGGFGILPLILFPIFIPINYLMNCGVIGTRNEIKIEPIIKPKLII
jgi:hypothetical protein